MKTLNTVEELKAAPPGQYKLAGAALQKVVYDTFEKNSNVFSKNNPATLLRDAIQATGIEVNNDSFEAAAEYCEQPIKLEHGHKMPKLRRKAGDVPKAVSKAIADYKEAYKALYGAPIDVEYKEGYLNGVSLKIFRQRINQLKYRKGG